jgi:peptide/nickel transport system substrate-binding protein
MDLTNVFDNESIWVFEQIYQMLYTVTPDGKSLVPQLATGYTVSPDKKTYTFTLRSGVKFSTGQPMTSADVKFSLDKSRAAAKGWGYIDTAIKDIKAPTPSTVVIDLKFPWAPLLADLSLFSNGIVPNNYGGKTAGRDRPVQVGLLAQGQLAQAGEEPLLLGAGQALPEQRHLDRRAQRQHAPASAARRPGAGR